MAIGGSRASTAYGDRVAADLASQLAEAGQLVVDAGFGIGAAAIRSAVDVGGHVVVVL